MKKLIKMLNCQLLLQLPWPDMIYQYLVDHIKGYLSMVFFYPRTKFLNFLAKFEIFFNFFLNLNLE